MIPFIGKPALRLLLLISSCLVIPASAEEADHKVVIGWLEKAYLPQYDFSLRAKMDTGAKNSSLHALDLEYVPVPGKPVQARIRFKTEDTRGNVRTIEADVVRTVKIKKPSLTSLTPLVETRVEIELEICLAGVLKRINVNLTDRTGMNYRMILGRSALAGDFMVDVERTFTGSSTCQER